MSQLTAPKPVAYGYTRVSTRFQAKHGDSHAAQQEKILAYYNWKLKDTHTWGGFHTDPHVSASVHFLKRPAGMALNGLLKSGDAVLVAHIDRGFRDPIDMLSTIDCWQERGINLHALNLSIDTASDVGRLILLVIGEITRWERKRIGQRYRESMARLREQGVWTHRCTPYGHKIVTRKHTDGKMRNFIEPCDENRAWGRYFVALKETGLSWYKVYRRCLDLRLKRNTKMGLLWNETGVAYFGRKELAMIGKDLAAGREIKKCPVDANGVPIPPDKDPPDPKNPYHLLSTMKSSRHMKASNGYGIVIEKRKKAKLAENKTPTLPTD